MFCSKENKWFLPIPRTGSSAVICRLLDLGTFDGPIPSKDLPYPGKLRHPFASQAGVVPGQKVVVTARNPIDRWNSIKRFIEPRQNNIYASANINSGISYHLLQHSIEVVIDVPDVELQIMRFENLGEDFLSFFPSFQSLEPTNHLYVSNIGEDDELTYREADLIKRLCPYEWELYLCDEDDRVKSLLSS